MTISVLPWHQSLRQQLPAAAATLLVGEAGIGSGELALAVADDFCGGSADGADAANPDLLITLPENNNISVAAVRHIAEFLSFAPVSRRRRVAVILRAEQMHISAANALLKTLEEPQPDRALLLWTHAVQQLPATIISRCRLLHVPPPDAAAAAAYAAQNGGGALLAFCANRPLAAAEYPADWPALLAGHFQRGSDINVNEAVAAMNVNHDGKQHWQHVVETYLQHGARLNPHCLDWAEKSSVMSTHGWLEGLQKWVSDGVRVSCQLPPLFFPQQRAALQQLSGNQKQRWLDFYRYLAQRRALVTHPLVADLFIREILYAYRRLCAD